MLLKARVVSSFSVHCTLNSVFVDVGRELEMGRRVEACAKCMQKCSRIQKNRKNSTTLFSSFFKVMIGDQFTKFLSFPPKFAPMVSSLIGRETFLEDASGQRWKVNVSILKNSVVLRQGWDEFASDHGLQFGDFLVFNYIIGSHFEVYIFGKNACEKVDFSVNRNQRKQAETNARNLTTQEGPCLTVGKGTTNSNGPIASVPTGVEICQGRRKVKNDMKKVQKVTKTTTKKNGTRPLKIVPKAACIEDHGCILTGDSGNKEDKYESTVIDLSDLELTKNTSGKYRRKRIVVGNTKRPHDAPTSLTSQNEAGLSNGVPLGQGLSSAIVPFGVPDFEMRDGNSDPVKMDNLVAVSDKNSGDHKVADILLLSTSPWEMLKGFENNCDLSNGALRPYEAEGTDNAQLEEEPEVIKLKQGESTESPTGCNDKASGTVILATPDVDESPKSPIGGSDKASGVMILATPDVDESPKSPIGGSDKASEVMILATPDVDESPKSPIGGSDKASGMMILATPDVDGSPKSPIGGIDKASGAMILATPDVDAHALTIADNVSCLNASDTQPYLDLPTPLPSLPRVRGKKKREKKVIYLRDPDMRAWPVLLKEISKCTTLMGGWEAFSKANSLQPGDQCIFRVGDLEEEIFIVSIIRGLHV